MRPRNRVGVVQVGELDGVARAVEAFVVEGGCGEFGGVEVAGGDHRVAHADLVGVLIWNEFDLRSGDGHADAAGVGVWIVRRW
jgi:hypothetical protein